MTTTLRLSRWRRFAHIAYDVLDPAFPWITYTFVRPDWWTRIFGRTEVHATCTLCHEHRVIPVTLPRFGRLFDVGPHPLRLAFIVDHLHTDQ